MNYGEKNKIALGYSINYEFQKIFRRNKWLSQNLSEINHDNVEYLFRLNNKLKSYKPASFADKSYKHLQSDLILLPKAKIIVVDNWVEIVKEINNRNLNLFDMSWEKFEDFIGYLLEQFGWKISPMARTKDDGIDLIATQELFPKIPFRMMVQCKKFHQNHKVGLSIVKEVWSTKWDNGFHQAMIATTSYFTKGALERGEKWDLQLRDHDNILQWVKETSDLVSC